VYIYRYIELIKTEVQRVGLLWVQLVYKFEFDFELRFDPFTSQASQKWSKYRAEPEMFANSSYLMPLAI